jgi:hypothetical protein
MRCAQAFSVQLLNQRREHALDFRGLLSQFSVLSYLASPAGLLAIGAVPTMSEAGLSPLNRTAA